MSARLDDGVPIPFAALPEHAPATLARALRHAGEGARLAILTDRRRAAAFHLHAPEATVLTEAAALGETEGAFDAAVVEGLLEAERWDRWALQRLHRALRAGGVLVLAVPALACAGSAADLRFLAYTTRKALERGAERWRPGLQLGGVIRRRYGARKLVRMLRALGYTAITLERARGAAASAWISARLVVIARKGASLPGVRGRRWPAGAAHLHRYAREYERLAAIGARWLAEHPEWRAGPARELHPSAWRGARVLVLSPHPDDELIGCGGTLLRLAAAGASVSIAQATDGWRLVSLAGLAPETRRTVRQVEAKRVAGALGAGLVLWREEDGRLRCCERTVGELARLAAERQPTHVFTPFLGDSHADHLALSRTLAAALAQTGLRPEVLQYEVWGRLPATRYCDVTREMTTLERLLFLYEHAMRVDDFVHFCADRNLARSLELTGRPGYVEPFLATTSAEFRRLAERPL